MLARPAARIDRPNMDAAPKTLVIGRQRTIGSETAEPHLPFAPGVPAVVNAKTCHEADSVDRGHWLRLAI
jgi:hypothetical protein